MSTAIIRIDLDDGDTLFAFRVVKAWSIVRYRGGQPLVRYGYVPSMVKAEQMLVQLQANEEVM